MPGEEIVIPGVGDGGAATEVIDSPAEEVVVEEPVVEPGAEGEDTPAEPAADETPAEDDLSDIETDGRKIDAATRAEIAALKKTNPAAAKKWAESYFRTQAVMKEFPEAKNIGEVVAQVRAAKATIESLGGEQGIADLQTEVTESREEMSQFAAGDPALIEKLYNANPESLVTASQNVLQLLEQKDIKAFDKALLPSLAGRLKTAGLGTAVKNLLGLVKEGKGQEAYDLLGDVDKWIAGIEDKAKTLTEGKTKKNPEADALAEDRKKLDTERQELRDQAVGTEVNKLNNSAVSKLVEPFFRDAKITNDVAKRKFIGLVQSDVYAAMKADKTFQRLAHAMKAKGDHAKTAQFIATKFAELLPEHFKANRNSMYPSVGSAPVKKPGTPPGTPTKPAVLVAAGQRPKGDQVDWGKTTDAMWIAGKAVLTNGKSITFPKDAPSNRY